MLFGQDTRMVTIQDSITNEPLRFATAYFKKNNHIGFVTDLNGQFVIDAPTSLKHQQDTLICSFVGYEEKLFPVNFETKENLVIYLSSKVIRLQEVEVTSKKRNLAPLEIIKKAIKLVPKNYETKPVYLDAFYRELIKEDDKAIQVNEAFTKLFYTGYKPKKSFLKKSWRKYWSPSGYEATFEFSPGKNLFLESQSFHYFNAPKDQAKIIAARASSNLSEIEPAPQGGPLGVTAGDKVKYLYDFLDKKNFSRYNYKLNQVNYYKGELCYIISFYPKSTNKAVFHKISRKMNFAIYAGNIYVSIESFAIAGIECQISSIADVRIYDDNPFKTELTVNYKKSGNKWYLNSIKTNQLQRLKVKNKSRLYECSRDLIVNKVQLKDVLPFVKKEELLEQKSLATLRYFPDTYKAELWDSLEKQKGYFPLALKAKEELEVNLPLNNQFKERFIQQALEIPTAKQEPSFIFLHGDSIQDNYQWLEQNDSTTLQYLAEENKFFKNYMIPSRKMRKDYLVNVNSITVNDTSNTSFLINERSYFWDDSDTEFPVLYRTVDNQKPKTILDVSSYLKQGKYLDRYEISPNNQLIAFSISSLDSIGSKLYIKKIDFDEILSQVDKVNEFKWYDNNQLLYSTQNKQRRANQVFSHLLKNTSTKDELIFEEKDATFDITLSKSKNYLFIISESLEEVEILFTTNKDASPKFVSFLPRMEGHRYRIIPDGNQLFVLTNWKAPNFKLIETSIDDLSPKNWKEIIAEQEEVLIDDFTITKDFIVTKTIHNAQAQIQYYNKKALKREVLSLESKHLSIDIDKSSSPLSNSINLFYSSPKVPYTNLQVNLDTKEKQTIRKTKLNKQIQLDNYEIEKKLVRTKENVKIPITIYYHKTNNVKHNGLILKAYGAYGALNLPQFNPEELVLLDRGFTIVHAHIRGSRARGNKWYQNGKLFNKKNSFKDYIACANYLIKKNYTTPDYLVGYGQSAGGLIMGYVINENPNLFKTIILDYPYLDVINTMMDEELPLTTTEFKEWGDIRNKVDYEYIKSYSPYQNIRPNEYPNLLFFAGLKDFQTPYWQIGKTVAKLRKNNLGQNDILLNIDLSGGHMGVGGENWRKKSTYIYAFVIQSLFGSIEAFENK